MNYLSTETEHLLLYKGDYFSILYGILQILKMNHLVLKRLFANTERI